MKLKFMNLCAAIVCALLSITASAIEMPVSTDDRLVIELVAQEPDIVTPTFADVDDRGRIWAIENNTHQRPKNYKGFESDRIKIYDDFGPDGRAKKITTFADGFKNAMSLKLGRNGDVFFATRSEVYLLRDTNNDGVADEKKTIAKLDTPGDYPHNGLCGLELGPDGNLYFGMGENLGAPYKLIGSDGVTLSGGGEGGNIYRSKPDGSRLERIATGVWNPFGLGFDSYGRLFCVDNDPDGRPPCRLFHVAIGGDYGYRFRYGRKGQHPFIAWNGEIPGTLPMMSGTGEAPCAVLACEFAGWPKDWRGDLLVTSWGDHAIQRFKPVAEGASFRTHPETLIKGGGDFRPVALVPAPDGSLIMTDWVSSSYPVHGKGRIWRIKVKDAKDDGLRVSKLKDLDAAKLRAALSHDSLEIRSAAAEVLAQKDAAQLLDAVQNEADPRARSAALHAGAAIHDKRASFVDATLRDKSPEVRLAAMRFWAEDPASDSKLIAFIKDEQSAEVRAEAVLHLRDKQSTDAVLQLLPKSDAFVFSACIDALARLGNIDVLLKSVQAPDARVRLGVLLSLRRFGDLAARTAIPAFLKDSDHAVRRAAMQWIGEDKLTDLAGAMNESTKQTMTRDLFQAYLAAQSLLSGDKPDKGDYPESLVTQVLTSDKQPPNMRAMALRSLRIENPALTVAKLKEWMASEHAELRIEATRALTMHQHADAQPELRKLATDAAIDLQLRADAVAGLALSASTPDTQQLLKTLLETEGTPVELQREAIRALRGVASTPDVQQILKTFAGKLNALAAEVRGELAEQLLLALKAGGVNADELKDIAALTGTRPANEAEWQAKLAQQKPAGNAAAGRRLFYHTRGAQCFLCHRVDGRGGNVGPDLSTAGQIPRERLLQSILEPSREVGPLYTPFTFMLKDGRTITGIGHDEITVGSIAVTDSSGKVTKIKFSDVEKRVAQKGSLMPDSLVETMTQQELLDLVEFLSQTGASKPEGK